MHMASGQEMFIVPEANRVSKTDIIAAEWFEYFILFSTQIALLSKMSTLTGMIMTLRDIPPSPTSRTVAPTVSPLTMPPSSTGSQAETGTGATGVIARVRMLGERALRATLLGGLQDVWDQVSANEGVNYILYLFSHSQIFRAKKKTS